MAKEEKEEEEGKEKNGREASPLDIVEIWEDVRLDFLRYHSAAGIERVNNGG